MKSALVLFFLMTAFVGFARAEESSKPEYVWVEPADTSESGQVGGEASGFTVKPIG